MHSAQNSEFTANSLLTSYQVGALLQVNPSSVNKWVKDGRIPAFRTPGGHRRIRAADLVAFLTEHQIPIPESLTQTAKKRVLIASTDASELRSLEQAFSELGDRIEIMLSNDNLTALVKLGSFKPHLIVLEMGLNESGLEVCRKLHQNPDTAEIKILLSGHQHPDAQSQRQAEAAGAAGLLPHPLSLDYLRSQLGLDHKEV